MGQIVNETKVVDQAGLKIDLSNSSAGIYTIRFADGSGHSLSRKVVKE